MTTDLRALETAAAEGPWRHRRAPEQPDRYRYVAFSKRRDEGYTTGPLEPGDAALIAAARNALPYLLDVVDAARSWSRSEWPMRDALAALNAHLRGDAVKHGYGFRERQEPEERGAAADFDDSGL